MRIRRPMVAATLTLLAALAAASPASAAPGNGAHVVNESDCIYPEGPYVYGTICGDLRYVQNLTETPSGNLSGVQNLRNRYKFTGSGPMAGCSYSGSQYINFHFLDGPILEESSRLVGEFSFDCQGTSYECTVESHFHYANGEVQFARHQGATCYRA